MTKHWIQLVAGLCILISPWTLGFSELFLAAWSNVLLGLIVVIMNAWSISEYYEKRQASPKTKV